MTTRLTGLIEPESGWQGSSHPALLSAAGAGGVELMGWDEIKEVAASGELDGRKRYGSSRVIRQLLNNCADASATRALEKAIYDSRGGKFVKLSPCYVYSLVNDGRDQGAMLYRVMEKIQTVGTCLETTVGPDVWHPSQYDQKAAKAEAARFKALECYAIRPRDFATRDDMWRGLFTALCRSFKLCVAIQAGRNFDRIDDEGICGVDNGRGNHAVHVDGIAMASEGDIVGTSENTWGVQWGRQGRMLLTTEHFEDTIGTHEFYAIRSVQPDPMDGRPKVRKAPR